MTHKTVSTYDLFCSDACYHWQTCTHYKYADACQVVLNRVITIHVEHTLHTQVEQHHIYVCMTVSVRCSAVMLKIRGVQREAQHPSPNINI